MNVALAVQQVGGLAVFRGERGRSLNGVAVVTGGIVPEVEGVPSGWESGWESAFRLWPSSQV